MQHPGIFEEVAVLPDSRLLSDCRDVLAVLLARELPAKAVTLRDLCTQLNLDHYASRKALTLLEAQDAVALQTTAIVGERGADALTARSLIKGPLLDTMRIREAIISFGLGDATVTTPSLPAITVLASANSTNSLALAAIDRDELNTPVLFAAESQPQGRGRQGRRWHAGAWRNLICSQGWRVAADVGRMGGLSLVAGLCVAEMVAGLGVGDVGIKWPNDVMISRHKLAGILVEAQRPRNHHGQLAVVIGIGMNVDVSGRQDAEIGHAWRDLNVLTPTPDRNALIAELYTRIERALALFLDKGFEPFQSRYSAYDMLTGERLKLQIGKVVHDGRVEGVDSGGRLRLRTANGVQAFTSGHIVSLQES